MTSLRVYYDPRSTEQVRFLDAVNTTDTIAAIATATGEAGIAVVRLSGPEALRIADRVFLGKGRNPSERPTHTVAYGVIRTAETRIDEVLLLVLRAPHTYTTEDVVEIQCHGGSVVARRILQTVLQAGARLAEPGEFTKRAFLNGRIDLIQAEAVLDVIRAKSDLAASVALEQLEGALSRSVQAIYDGLITAASDAEALLDFPEEDLPISTIPKITESISAAKHDILRLLETWNEGHVLRDGALVVIIGKTNVGKSTLLNALLGRDRAIVSPIHGTTRDAIEETVIVDGYPFRLVDTAGLRETECSVEQEGMRRTRNYREKADVIIRVIDASGSEERAEWSAPDGEEQRTIFALNKCDLGFSMDEKVLAGLKSIRCVFTQGVGVEEIRRTLVPMLGGSPHEQKVPHAVISERHRALLESARKELDLAMELLALQREDGVVLSVAHLRTAIESIGEITGRNYSEELLSSIFSRYCVGK